MNDQNQNTTTEVSTTGNQAPGKFNIVPVAVVVALLLMAGGYFMFNKTSGSGSELSPAPSAMSGNSTSDTSVVADPNAKPVEFTVTGSNFKFDTEEITVKKGDTVDITFKNAEGKHDFVIDEFNVKSTLLSADGEETVSFIADKAGTFEYYCSVGNHRQMGMVGKLIVE